MRTYLIFSKEADGIPLAMKIEREGHRTIVYINDIEERGVGEGLVEKAKLKDQIVKSNGSLDNSALSVLLKETNPDCVVFDMIGKGIGKAADIIRKERPVVGASLWAEVAELNEMYGIKILEMAGINFLPKEGVQGIKVLSEVWFNGKEVINVTHTMEEKSFMENSIGPRTYSMGSVMWNGKKTSKLYIEGIGKLEDTLHHINYKGPISLNTIITQNKLYGLELITKISYSTIFIFNELLKDKFSDLLYGAATGVIKQVGMREGFAMGVTFAILPFPSPMEKYKEVAKEIAGGKEIGGINADNIKHIWLGDVYKNGEQYLCSGVNGMLGVVTARWDTPGENPLREAKRRCYRTLSNLIIPDVMYREDIGERVARDKTQLESWGWL